MQEKHCLKLVKNIYIFIGIILPTFFLFDTQKTYALSTDTINLQGKIVRNDIGYEGLNVTAGSPSCVVSGSGNDTCDFRVRYYSASSGGTLFLTEEFSDEEIGQYNGAFNLSLGSDPSPTAGSYSSLDALIAAEDTVYVEIGFDPAGGNSYTETFTRMPVQATAFAIRSKYSSHASTAFQFDTAANSSGYSSPSAGMVYWDTTDTELKVYNGSSWVDVGGAGGSSLWTDSGTYTYLTGTSDHLVLGSSSYTAIGSDDYATYVAGLSSRTPFSFDMTAERLTLSGDQVRSGLTVYSNYASTSAWPLVLFKTEDSGFDNLVLEIVQDGTGDLLSMKKGSTEVFTFENAMTFYMRPRDDAPSTYENRLYNITGTLYWNGSPVMTGVGPLWTDGGTYTYLTSTTDDLVLGGNSPATSKFYFDMTNGRLGIGTDSPTAKLDIAGASSTISNSSGDITISPYANLVLEDSNFVIPNTTYSALYGILYKGSDRFLHNFNYGDNSTVITEGGNLFLGIESGNFTMGATATETYHSSYNVAVGEGTLEYNETGYYNNAFGYKSLYVNTTGRSNTAMGHLSLYSNTSGYSNTAIGTESLKYNTEGRENTALGKESLKYTTTGRYNTALGKDSANANTTGYYNTAIGMGSLFSNQTGSSNVVIGYNAGYYETGSSKLYIANSDTTTPLIYGLFSGTGAGVTIYSQATDGVPLIVKGITSQSSNLQQWQDSSGTVLGYIDALGGLVLKRSTNSTDAYSFQDSSGSKVLEIDTTNKRVGIGTGAPSSPLQVAGGSGVATVTLGRETGMASIVSSGTTATIVDGGGGTGNAHLNYYSTGIVSLGYGGGNVAIGTIASPEYPLDVSGTARFRSKVILQSNSTSVSVNALGDQESMVPNAGFEINEDGESSLPDGWYIIANTTSYVPAVVSSTSAVAQGANALRLAADSDTAMHIQSTCIPITDGETYHLYLKARAGAASGDGFYLRLITWDGADCTGTSTQSTVVSNSALNATITTYGGTATATSTAKSARVRILWSRPNSVTYAYFDSVKLGSRSGAYTIDLAENFYSETNIDPGYLLKTDDSLLSGVTQTNEENQSSMIGIVSTKPAITLGEDIESKTDKHIVEVALSGRVPTIVSTKNGNINSGDYITSSSELGVGVKSINAGRVIGTALESTDRWNASRCPAISSTGDILWPQDDGSDFQVRPCYMLPNGTFIGKIMVFVNSTWYDPDVGDTKKRISELDYKMNSLLELLDTSLYGDNIIENGSGDTQVDLVGLGVPTQESLIYVNSQGYVETDESIQVKGGKLLLGEGNSGVLFNPETGTIEFQNEDGDSIALGESSSSVLLSAEYPGAVFSADGINNQGSMISDSEGTSFNSMNYYLWESTQPVLNDYDIRVRYKLPSNFEQWGNGGITFSFATDSVSLDDNKVDFYVYKQGSTLVDAIAEDQVSLTKGHWGEVVIPGQALNECNRSEDICVFVIKMSSRNGYFTKVGDIQINYRRKL